MLPLPRFTADGLLDYAGLAIGLSIGFALLRGPAHSVEEAISKR
jgi:hypothetical protein